MVHGLPRLGTLGEIALNKRGNDLAVEAVFRERGQATKYL
jgi:hypothetical protein